MPEQPNNSVSLNLRAILFGALADIGLTLVVGLTLGLVVASIWLSQGFSQGDIETMFAESVGLIAAGMLAGTGCSLVGGYVAGRTAGGAEMIHGLLAGCLAALLGLLLQSDSELWLDVLGFIVTPLAGAVGGHLAQQEEIQPVA